MHCNHRRRAGACKDCWRGGIIMWSIMWLGLVGMLLFVPSDNHSLWPWTLVAVTGALIGHSILTKWKMGDR